MALEHVTALEILFGNLGNSGQVEERVRLFDKFRRPRALMTQIVSNAGLTKYGDVEAEVRKYYSDRLLPPALPYSEPWLDIFFGYDVFEDAKAIL